MDTETTLGKTVNWLFAADPLDDAAVEERARLLFLDTLGCMIAGLAKPEPAALVKSLAALDAGGVLLPGAGLPLTTVSAAYITGLAACWDEACEGLPRAHGRPGLHAFAATLPLALARGHSLGEALSALTAGFEVAGRLGEMLRIAPGMHVDGIWGTFGAVTAAARLLRMTPAATVKALQGAACDLPYSQYLPVSHGANVRNAYVGNAAVRGLLHAFAVMAGVTTPPGAIDAYDTLALGGDPTTKSLAPAGLWLIKEGYLKPFAAVRHVHYGAQAAIDWRQRSGADHTTDIRALELSVYGEAMTYCGNRAPATPIQAQFSLSYGLAWALLKGDLGPDAYDESALRDPEVRRLEALVQITENVAYTAINKRAAQLTVHTSKATETITIDAVPGEVDLPMSAQDVAEKFIRYTTPVIGQHAARTMATTILQAPLSSPLKELMGN